MIDLVPYGLPAQVALLKAYPRVNQLSSGSLYLYDSTYKTKHADELKKMTAEATAGPAVIQAHPIELLARSYRGD